MPQSKLHPVARGHWTDEEMLAATGAASLGVVKLMQRDGLVTPGDYQKSNGQHARAWSLDDLFRIALVVDLTEETGFNLSTCVVILAAIGKRSLSNVFSTEAVEASLQRAITAATERSRIGADGLPTIWKDTVVEVSRKDRARLAIVDRKNLFLLERTGGKSSEPFSARFVGCLSNARSNSPTVEKSSRRQPMTHGDMEGERSVLEVKLCNLAERPFDALGAEILIEVTPT